MLEYLLVSSALALTVDQVPRPAADAWVSDVADVIQPETEATLNTLLTGLNKDTGAEVAVVTVPSASADPKTFCTELFNTWKLGSAERNDGLLVLLVMDARRLEMEPGDGLEGALPDGWLGTMQLESMVPSFKSGDFGGGLLAGVRKVDERIRSFAGAYPPSPTALSAAPAPASSSETLPSSSGSGGLPWLLLGGGAGGLLALFLGLGALVHRRKRMCPTCKTLMAQLDEVADDAHLDEGQRLEESLGSVDHEIRVCATCGHVAHFENVSFFSGYSKCGQCGVRASRSSTVTEVSATYDHGGRVRTTTECKKCGHHSTSTRSTPKLTRPAPSSSSSSRSSGSTYRSSSSSSRSSSSRSFGGGRSRAGGAGNSW